MIECSNSKYQQVRFWEFRGGTLVGVDSVPLTDRGFRYGMHVFETIAVMHGRLLFKKSHLLRWQDAAEQMGLCFPEGFDQGLNALEHLLDGCTGIARCFLTAGDGAPSDFVGVGRLFVCFEEAVLQPLENSLRIVEGHCHVPGFPKGVKSGNYWFNIMQLQQARAVGYDNILLFNAVGELVSAATANVFLWLDGHWVTPILSSGCRRGCVRGWVIERFACEERLVTRSDLTCAQALFLTNSRLGLAAVRELNTLQLEIPNSFLKMRDTYWKEVAEHH